MALNLRTFAVIGMMLITFSLLAGAAFAKNDDKHNGTRPGWGFGDKNHKHTGPPGGPSVHPVHHFAKFDDFFDGFRFIRFFGWGFGDKNHDHKGPGGLFAFLFRN